MAATDRFNLTVPGGSPVPLRLSPELFASLPPERQALLMQAQALPAGATAALSVPPPAPAAAPPPAHADPVVAAASRMPQFPAGFRGAPRAAPVEQDFSTGPAAPDAPAGEDEKTPRELVRATEAPKKGEQQKPGSGLRYGSPRELTEALIKGEISGQDFERQKAILTLAMAANSRTVSTPASWGKKGEQVVTEGDISPETEEALADARISEGVAAIAVEDARAAALTRKAAEDQRMAEGALRQVAEDKARRAQQDAEIAALRRTQDEAIQNIGNGEIDPDRYFKSKGAGARIVAAIAVALGEMGKAYTGGDNAALGIIQSNIERDIDSQRAGMQKAKDSATAAGNALADLLQMYGTPEVAEAALRERYWMATKAKSDALQAGQAVGPETLANLQKIGAVSATKAAEARAAIEAARYGKRVEEYAMSPGSSYTTGPSAKEVENATQALANSDDGGDPNTAGLAGLPPGVRQGAIQERNERAIQITVGPDAGTIVWPQSASSAERYRIAIESRGKAIQALRKIRQLTEQRDSLVGQERQQVNREIAQWATVSEAATKAAQNTGVAVSPREQQNVDRVSGGTVLDWYATVRPTSSMLAELDDAIATSEAQYETSLTQVSRRPDRFEPFRRATPDPVKEE